jgi:hypothetical protein
MRKKRSISVSKDTARRELAAALANYRGPIKRCPQRSTGGSNKRRPPKPRTDRHWLEA